LLSSGLKFDDNQADLGIPDILDRMRRQWLKPLHGGPSERSRYTPAIKEDIPAIIAPDEITCADNVNHSWTTVRVDGYQVTRRNVSVDHAYALVLKQSSVVGWCGDQRI
jgi:hypothetical protein